MALLMDRDKRALEAIGVPAAVNVGNVLSLRCKLAIEDKATPAQLRGVVREYMGHLEPIILDAMIAGHLSGHARTVRLAARSMGGKQYAMGAFDDAIAYFKKRMTLPANALQKLKNLFSPKAARVVKDASDAVEKHAQAAVEESLRLGEPVAAAKARLKTALDAAGINEASPFLCETLVRTNVGAAYSAGSYEALQDPELEGFHQGFQYSTVGDNRVRETHAEWDGFVGDKDDEFWKTHYPLCGWNCRCVAIPLFGHYESNIPDYYEDADEGDNPLTGLPWGEAPE